MYYEAMQYYFAAQLFSEVCYRRYNQHLWYTPLSSRMSRSFPTR